MPSISEFYGIIIYGGRDDGSDLYPANILEAVEYQSTVQYQYRHFETEKQITFRMVGHKDLFVPDTLKELAEARLFYAWA